MPVLKVNISHSLAEADAIDRIKKFADSANRHYPDKVSNLRIVWKGNKAEFYFDVGKTKIKGDLLIKPGNLTVSGKIPIAFVLFKNQITSLIKKQAQSVLK